MKLVVWMALLFRAFDLLKITHGFEFKLREHDEECFTIFTPKWKEESETNQTHFLTAHYELISNSFKEGLHVFVVDDHDNDLFATHGQTVDRFQVELKPSSKYRLCLENTGHREEVDDDFYEYDRHMILGLNFMIRSRPSIGGGTLKDQADQWYEKADEVASFLQDLEDYLGSMRAKEGRHRDLTERTFTSILWWTLGELFMVCSLAGGQILYFRRFLERRTRF